MNYIQKILGSTPRISEFNKLKNPFGTNNKYASYTFQPFAVNNGLKVYNNSDNVHAYGQMQLWPFANDPRKPDLSKGTISFYAAANGAWRGKGNDTYIRSNVYYYLTSNTYVRVFGPAKKEYTAVYFYSNGTLIKKIELPEYTTVHFVIQWDYESELDNGSHLSVYVNNSLLSTVTSNTKETDRSNIKNFTQYFLLKSHTDDGVSYRPSTAYAKLDEVKIWTEIIPIEYFQ